jgi:sodium transport system permease protein
MLNVVLIPLFLYPLLGFGILQVMQMVRGVGERTATVVALAGDVPAAVRDSLAAGENVQLVDAGGAGPEDAAAFRAWRDARAARGEAAPHALLRWTPGASGDSARVYYDAARDRSREARGLVEDAIDAWRREKSLAAMRDVGLDAADLDRFRVESVNTASAVQRGREILASGLPVVLLLMLAVGTAAASLDTIVGERERGTFETILVSPLARADVLLGKYLFVVLAAVTAFVLNLFSMSLFLGFVLKLVDLGEDVRVALDPLSCLLVLGAAILTAALLAAVFMVIAIPSRTYREGQAALSPAYLLAMVPGLVVGTSREPFGLTQAFVPVLNATALFEAALRGDVDAPAAVVTYAVLAVTALAAIALAARIAAREDVFLEPRFSLRELLRGRGAS